jgi:hypothetical protein
LALPSSTASIAMNIPQEENDKRREFNIEVTKGWRRILTTRVLKLRHEAKLR